MPSFVLARNSISSQSERLCSVNCLALLVLTAQDTACHIDICSTAIPLDDRKTLGKSMLLLSEPMHCYYPVHGLGEPPDGWLKHKEPPGFAPWAETLKTSSAPASMTFACVSQDFRGTPGSCFHDRKIATTLQPWASSSTFTYTTWNA